MPEEKAIRSTDTATTLSKIPNFQIRFLPLKPKFYKAPDSHQESLALSFDPTIDISQGSNFKAISDASIDSAKKTIYVCRPSPEFFDSNEKLIAYLRNIQELEDQNFDVRFIYQDENGNYKSAKITDLSFQDEKNKTRAIGDYLITQDQIDIKEAKKQLGIEHDSSLFLDEIEIYQSKIQIDFNEDLRQYEHLDVNLDVNLYSILQNEETRLSDLKKIFDKSFSDDLKIQDKYLEDKIFKIILINNLNNQILVGCNSDNKPINLELFKEIIDFIYKPLIDIEKKEKIFFPFNSIKNIITSTFTEPKFSSHYQYLTKKIAENPLPRTPLSYEPSYKTIFISCQQNNFECQFNYDMSEVTPKTRDVPDIEKLKIVKTSNPLKREDYKNLVQFHKEVKFGDYDSNFIFTESSIELHKNELVPISHGFRNTIKHGIIGYSIQQNTESSSESLPEITFYQDPETNCIYAKSNQDCKINILLKNQYNDYPKLNIAHFLLLKQENPDYEIEQQTQSITLSDKQKNIIISLKTRPSEKVIIGNASSTAVSNGNSSSPIRQFFAGDILARRKICDKTFSTRDENLTLAPKQKLDKDWLDITPSNMAPEDLRSKEKTESEFNLSLIQQKSKPISNKTTCLFKSSLKKDKLIKLHSIASDDEILAFTSKSPDNTSQILAKIQFFKDENGYYYAKSDQDCILEYITTGTELERYKVRDFVDKNNDSLSTDVDQDNFSTALKILKEFSSSDNFKYSVESKDIKLPNFTNGDTDKFLDELFAQPSSCRHRVMAVAHKFQKQGLKNGEDFRIIGTSGDHTEIELKQPDDKWVIIDLGGENSQTIPPVKGVTKPVIDDEISKILVSLNLDEDKLKKLLDQFNEVVHNFKKRGLKNGEGFRIIGTKGSNTEIELKQPDDKRDIIDLGGENSQTIPPNDLPTNNPTPAQAQDSSSQTIPPNDSPTNNPPQAQAQDLSQIKCGCFTTLKTTLKNFLFPRKKPSTSQQIKESTKLTQFQPAVTTSPASSPISPQLAKIPEISSALIKDISSLTKFSTISDISSSSLVSGFGQQENIGNSAPITSIQAIADQQALTSSKASSTLLYYSSQEDKKLLVQHLLAQHKKHCLDKIIAQPFPISSTTLNQEVNESVLVITSSLDLSRQTETLFVLPDDETKSSTSDILEISANTRLAKLLKNAKDNPHKSVSLFIDWDNFSDKMKVACNSMFDETDRRIGNLQIPANVKIICFSDSKKTTEDVSISSRFAQAFAVEISQEDLANSTSQINKDCEKKLAQSSSIDSDLSAKEYSFDLAGYPDWKSRLLGNIELQGDQIIWQPSQFIKDLQEITSPQTTNPENSTCKFTFSNINKEKQQELTEFLNNAISLGFVEYQGQQIKLPQNFIFEFAEKEFEFDKLLSQLRVIDSPIQQSAEPQNTSLATASTLSAEAPETTTVLSTGLTFTEKSSPSISSQTSPQIRIVKNCQLQDLFVDSFDQSSKIYTVNNFFFDKLLTSPIVDEEGKFYQEKGILEQHRGQNLKLFISGDLSTQQYYLLLSKAQEHKIKIDLLLAPQINLPKEINKKITESHELKNELLLRHNVKFKDDSPQDTSELSSTISSTKTPRIIITNDIAKSSSDLLNTLNQSNEGQSSRQSISVVNVEDLSVSDLFPSFDTQIVETSTPDSAKDLKKYQFRLKQLTSEIDEKLAIGDKIIIKGNFNDKLIKMLHQHFLATEKSHENLYFVIEEKDSTKLSSSLDSTQATNSGIYQRLSFLPSSQYKLEQHDLDKQTQSTHKILLPTSSHLYEDDGAGVGFSLEPQRFERTDYSTIITAESVQSGSVFVEAIPSATDITQLDNAQIKQQSESFITARKQILSELLKHSSLVKIVGESGVGKSSLLRELEKPSSDPSISDSTSPLIKTYNELNNIESWAKDIEGDNLKILVIDEYNVDTKMDYTMFRDFNQDHDPSKKREIFYQGKFYQLTDKHKVVFMGNPQEYGNRREGRLFEDAKVPTLELKDFSPEYIYQEILQKPILDPIISDTSKLPEAIKKSPELVSEFKKICDEEIKKYKAQNSGGVAKSKSTKDKDTHKKTSEFTVRELQEQVLLKLSKYIDNEINPQSATKTPISTDDFVETSSTTDNIEAIRNAIMIRKQQRQGLLPQSIIGTSGLIFEGDSGIGKSVMIEAVLKSQNIAKIKDSDELTKLPLSATNPSDTTQGQHYYYKIPANLSSQEIENQLIEASKRGVIVVFDEINTRLNEGLEKTINALLTGSHPSSKEPKQQPQAGFMIIGSINSAIYAGRSKLSPAIIHRSTNIEGKELKDYTPEDFKIIMQNWVEKNEKESIKSGDLEKYDSALEKLAHTFYLMLNPDKISTDTKFTIQPELATKIKKIPAESINLRNLKTIFLKSLATEIAKEKEERSLG